jgi:hypothetical protein
LANLVIGPLGQLVAYEYVTSTLISWQEVDVQHQLEQRTAENGFAAA